MPNKLDNLVIDRADLVDNPANPLSKVVLYKREDPESDNLENIDKAVWSTAFVNSLPDSSFAAISSGGKKDEEGKTVPRSLRHLPFKDENGKVDLPHLRNALARLSQTDIPSNLKASAERKLKAAANKAGIGKESMKKDNAVESNMPDTTEDILQRQEIMSEYWRVIYAYQDSVSDIMNADDLDDTEKSDLLGQSTDEATSRLKALFTDLAASPAIAKNSEKPLEIEKTLAILKEVDTLIADGNFEDIPDIVEGMKKMADDTKKTNETEVSALRKILDSKDAEIADLKKKLAPEVEDIWKGVNPKVKAEFEAIKKQAEEAEKLIKAAEQREAVLRITKQVESELQGVTGSTADKVTLLQKIESAIPPEQFTKLFSVLKAASEAVLAGKLLEEKGHTGAGVGGGSAFTKIKTKALEKMNSGLAKTEAEGIAKAAAENPELYREYLQEGR